jgi:hypothetical protein
VGFCSLQHLRNPRSTDRGLKRSRYVPSSGFGYPLDGLLPRIPGRFCFTPAALMGFTLRRFPLPESFTAFPPGRTHLPLALAVIPPPKRRTGPKKPRFLGPYLLKVPCDHRWFKPTITGASRGVRPSRAFDENLNPDFSGSPLTRFAGSGDCSPNPPAPQSIDQPSLRPARERTEARPGQSNPSGVSAPARS